MLLLLAFPAVLVAGLAVRSPFFDRYLVPALPSTAAVLVMGSRELRLRSARGILGACTLVVIALFSVFGTRDYMEHHRARWSLIEPLLARGVSPEDIDGGFEFGGWYLFGREGIGWSWTFRRQYVVSYLDELEGYFPNVVGELPRSGHDRFVLSYVKQVFRQPELQVLLHLNLACQSVPCDHFRP